MYIYDNCAIGHIKKYLCADLVMFIKEINAFFIETSAKNEVDGENIYYFMPILIETKILQKNTENLLQP